MLILKKYSCDFRISYRKYYNSECVVSMYGSVVTRMLV